MITGLRSGTDAEATVARIRNGVELRGANFWILVCAAMIASIGLNTSSVAVIIGAMLISPLMGPILGIGLGIAIHDRALLLQAFRTFGSAVAISLATSLLYFWVTPITTLTPELVARTSPTLLDVGIAFFGGVAGIIAGSRRETTTAIPGVAIATALMPPLCTAGYGLAVGNWPIFWGAFYLFFLNAVFISVATFLIVRLLRIPFVSYVDSSVERRVTRWIIVVVLTALAPSIVIFYDVISEFRQTNTAERFVREKLEVEGRKVLSWNLEPSDTTTVLRVYLAGPQLDSTRIDSLSISLVNLGLQRMKLKIVQLNIPVDTKTNDDDVQSLLRNTRLREELAGDIIEYISTHERNGPVDTIDISRIRLEMLAAFDRLSDVDHSRQFRYRRDTVDTVDMFLVSRTPDAPRGTRGNDLARMRNYLRVRLQHDSVEVLEIVGRPDTGTAR